MKMCKIRILGNIYKILGREAIHNSSRNIYDINGIAPTLPASMGMGGGYISYIVVESIDTIELKHQNKYE